MNKEDEHLSVKFYVKAEVNKKASEKAGRVIHDEVELVSIGQRGDRNTVFVARAHDVSVSHGMTYAERFAEEYKAFQDGREYVASGSALEIAPFISVARAADLNNAGVHTIEQLAALSPKAAKNLGMGVQDLVYQAKEWLESASDVGKVSEMQAEIDRLRKMVEGDKETPENDQYQSYSNEDLRNMIADATGVAPSKNTGRKKLIEKVEEMNRKAA